MHNSSLRRGIRASALAFLVLAATLAGAGCGNDGRSGATDPGPSDPGPSDPGPSDPGPGPQGPAPVGDVIYAVDLANNFLVFGTGSINVLSAKMRITGLPIFKRIIGIAIRPSDGKLIGVGNDSRVYTIDPLTAEATPVSSGPFSPKIVDFFDIHFAMALEPNGKRVRLIAAESGANWSISLADGTATSGEKSHYAAGTALEGQTPRLLGLAFPTLPDSAKQAGWCENLAYAIDADEAIMLAACDPATGEWWPTGESPVASLTRRPAGELPQASVAGSGSGPKAIEELKDQLLRCGEFMNSPSGSNSPGEPRPSEGGPWFPHSPDTEFYVFLVDVGRHLTTMGEVTLINPGHIGIELIGDLPLEDPMQTGVFAVGGPYGPSADSPSKLRQELRREAQLSVARDQESEPSTPPAPSSDPRAQCTSAPAH